MNQNTLTLDQRIRNLEKALLSFILFSASVFSLSNPEYISEIYGENGVVIYLGIFLVSLFFTVRYSVIIAISIMLDATNKTIVYIAKNENIVASVVILFLITVAIVSLNSYVGYTIRQIIGGVILSLLVYLLTNHKMIYNKICKLISKLEVHENKGDNK